MRKFWLVSWNEYRRHVFRLRFLIVILSPVLMLALVGLVSLAAIYSQLDRRPLGYVDRSGMFANASASQSKSNLTSVRLLPFPDEAAARAALQSRRIQGYYIILPSYPQDSAVELVADKPLDSGSEDIFEKFARAHLAASQPPKIAARLIAGTVIVTRAPDKSREVADNDWVALLLPLFSGLLFVSVINTSGGYLLQAVVDEKENRTMEIVITSVSANQLMAGKVAGNLSVGLTQLLIWISAPLGLFLTVREQIPFLSRISVQPQFFWLLGATMFPAFVMISALMAAIGATATESREAQQVAAMFSLPVMAPYWLFTAILGHPNSVLSRGLSYFPLTAPVTLTMRASATVLPAWEIALNLGILYLSAVLAVWLAGRVFRLGMLRYGRKLSLRDVFTFRPIQKVQA